MTLAKTYWAALPLACISLLGLLSCGGQDAPAGSASGLRAASPLPATVAPAPGLPDLQHYEPAPARASSYVEADLFHEGSEFDASLPNKLAVVDGDGALLSPGGSGYGGAAFCVYRFTAPGYDRNAQIRIEHVVNPSSFANSFIGLANWSTRRWDWFQDPTDGSLELASIAPYFNASGELWCAVLETGTDASDVFSLRLGGPAPTANLSATPNVGTPPLQVQLDASASLPGEGSITHYEWDIDGDGTFETDGGSTATLDHEYSGLGTYLAAVRITNSLGNSAVDSTPVKVSYYFKHTYGRSQADYFSASAVDSEGSIYLAGLSSNPLDSAESSLLLLKLSVAGNLEWSKGFRAAENAQANDLAVNANGDIILCGTVGSGTGRACLLQAWDKNGVLLWSKSYGTADADEANSLDLTDLAIYVGGSSATASGEDVTITKLDMLGTVDWSRQRDLGDSEYCRDVTVKRTGTTINGIIMVATQVYNPISNLWKVEWQPDGSLIAGKTITDPNLTLDINEVLYERPDTSTPGIYYMGGSLTVGGTNNLCVLAMPGSGSSLFGTRFVAESGEGVGLCFDSQHNLVLAGFEVPATNARAVLARFSGSDGTLLSALRSAPPASNVLPFALSATADGLLLAGATRQLGYEWQDHSPTPVAMSATWDDFQPGTGNNPAFSSADYLGNVTDLNALLNIDADDPDADAIVELLPEL